MRVDDEPVPGDVGGLGGEGLHGRLEEWRVLDSGVRSAKSAILLFRAFGVKADGCPAAGSRLQRFRHRRTRRDPGKKRRGRLDRALRIPP